MMSPTIVYLIRHGSTDFSQDRTYPKSKGPLLNEEGINQANTIATWFQSCNIDILYSSKAERCIATAKYITKQNNVFPLKVRDLEERDFGRWGGLSYDEIVSKDPSIYKLWLKDRINFKPPEGESILELFDRVNNWMEEVIKKHANRTIAVVSHAGPIRTVIVKALSMPLSNYRQLIISPGSVTKLEYTTEGSNLIFLGLVPFRT